MSRKPTKMLGAIALLATVAACTVNVQAPSSGQAPAPSSNAAPSTPAAAPASNAAPTQTAAQRPTAKTAIAFNSDVKLEPAKEKPVKLAKYYDDDELDAEVVDYEAEGGYDEDGDGDEDESGSMVVRLGDEDFPIEFDENDEPVMSEEPDTLVLTDKKTSVATTFATDQEMTTAWMTKGSFEPARFGLLSAEAKLGIQLNPDGTLTVNGQAVKNAEEGAKVAAQSEVVQGTSKQTFVALLARLRNTAQAEPEATRDDRWKQTPSAESLLNVAIVVVDAWLKIAYLYK